MPILTGRLELQAAADLLTEVAGGAPNRRRRRMIALFGYDDDPCLDAVAAADDLGVALLMIDQRVAADIEFVVAMGGGYPRGTATVAGQRCRLDDVDGVYARPLSPVLASDPRGNERSRMLHRAFLEWLDVAATVVVNRPR